jgi:cytochrome c-type biogenesis protein CcmH
MRLRLAFAALLLVPAALRADPVLAPEPLAYTQLPDAKQEARAQALMQTLRCVVCQGQSIADSDADLAGDMRAIVRERIAAGDSPETVRAWMVARYGRWVSYKPTVEPVTWPLWGAPLVLLVVGGFLARQTFHRRRRR